MSAGLSRKGKKGISPLRRQPFSVTILDHLREAIHDGYFMPGERLIEQSLAREFGVSRGPIRDALRELEREGLIVSEVNRGTYVAHLKAEDLEEIYSLRVALDQLAVGLACQRATDEHLAGMWNVIVDMEKAVANGLSGRDAVELDLQFHDAIYRASRHSRLISFWEYLRPQTKTMLLERVTELPNFSEIMVALHRALFDIISARNESGARELIVDHINNAYRPIATALKDKR